MNNTIRSRANKEIGDVFQEQWEITGKTVIAEPHPGDRFRGTPPRLGIYDYDVKSIFQQDPAKASTGKLKTNQPNVGGTRREASSVPLTVRRMS